MDPKLVAKMQAGRAKSAAAKLGVSVEVYNKMSDEQKAEARKKVAKAAPEIPVITLKASAEKTPIGQLPIRRGTSATEVIAAIDSQLAANPGCTVKGKLIFFA